jgi:methyl-accepting chemotaxis protein
MFQFPSIQRRLQLFSSMALALMFAIAGAAWWSIDNLAKATGNITMVGSALKSQQEADMMHDAIRGDVLALMLAAAKSDLAAVKAAQNDEVAHVAKFRAALQAANALPLDAKLREALVAVAPALEAYEKSGEDLMKIGLSGREPTEDELATFQTVFDQVEDAMGELSGLLDLQGNAYLEEANALNSLAQYVIAGVTLLAVILLSLVSRALARGIVGPLKQAVGLAEAVSGGDLTTRIESRSADETGQLVQALMKMRDSLSNTVSQVRSATDSINTASSEIASGNQDLSARTEQAASNLEETAASMEELTSTVSQSADAARQANQLAASASEVAVRGGQVVSQVVTTMEEINHSSKKINDIIGVIDGIAFQTNILALNAAVEAARAGEQGRGFAVVASEVRSLAQRSAEAAKEIKGLIGNSVDKVDAGSRLVAEAGQTMSEIVGSVQRVSDIIGEITAASGEQRDGISQVNTAVNQLDQMTQQNAALVEESAAAAESLRDQAMRLVQVVQVFQLGAPDPARVLPVTLCAEAVSQTAAKAAVLKLAVDKKPVASTSVSTSSKKPVPVAPASPSKSAETDWESF